jgi:hypothetical protein
MSWLPPAVCYARQVWVALMGLLKIIQYDRPSFPACVETLAWCVTLILSQPVIILMQPGAITELQPDPQHVHTAGAANASCTCTSTTPLCPPICLAPEQGHPGGLVSSQLHVRD